MAAPFDKAGHSKNPSKRTDFLSEDFDPLTALYSDNVPVPNPEIRPFDNIAQYTSVIQGNSSADRRRRRQAAAARASAAASVAGGEVARATTSKGKGRGKGKNDPMPERQWEKIIKKDLLPETSEDQTLESAMMVKGKEKVFHDVLKSMEGELNSRGSFKQLISIFEVY